MKHTALLIFAASCVWGGLARSAQIDFSQDGVEALFEDPTQSLPEISDGGMTLPASIETKEFPVEAGKKYKLEIRAEMAGDFVVETNDRAHILTVQSFKNRLSSTYEIVFFDANGEEIPGLGGTGPGQTPGLRGFFLSNQPQTYVFVFYPPANAAGLKLRFTANGRTTRITSLQLTEETAEDTINPNPDFRYGEWNYSGWEPRRDGRLYTRPDAKIVLNVGYGGTSPFFPLSAGKKYRLSVKGENPGDRGSVNIQYFDQDGNHIVNGFLFRPAPEGEERELTPPPGTALARIVMYNGVILEEFKVTEAE